MVSNGETAFPVATGVAAVIDLFPNTTACTCGTNSMACTCVGGTGLYTANTTATGSSLGVNILNHGGGGSGPGGGTSSGPFTSSSVGSSCPFYGGCPTAYNLGPGDFTGSFQFDYYGGVLIWSFRPAGSAAVVWTHAVIPSGAMPSSFFFTAFARTVGQTHTSYVQGPISVTCSPPSAPIIYRRGFEGVRNPKP